MKSPIFPSDHWENNQLIVEGRPRDGGFTDERYSLSDDAMQLRVELFSSLIPSAPQLNYMTSLRSINR